jgi:hypothetical protein
MKTSTAGVYGAGIENRKRKVKFEIQNSKSERNPNSENRIHDWGTTFGIRISDFGILPARHFSDAGLVGEKIGVIIFFYLETCLI